MNSLTSSAICANNYYMSRLMQDAALQLQTLVFLKQQNNVAMAVLTLTAAYYILSLYSVPLRTVVRVLDIQSSFSLFSLFNISRRQDIFQSVVKIVAGRFYFITNKTEK
jgi:hypothetical protein